MPEGIHHRSSLIALLYTTEYPMGKGMMWVVQDKPKTVTSLSFWGQLGS